MMRLDAELTSSISEKEEEKLIDTFNKYVTSEKPNIVILEDYNKGVLTADLIQKVITICKSNNVLVAVDPKRKNFFLVSQTYSGKNFFM